MPTATLTIEFTLHRHGMVLNQFANKLASTQSKIIDGENSNSKLPPYNNILWSCLTERASSRRGSLGVFYDGLVSKNYDHRRLDFPTSGQSEEESYKIITYISKTIAPERMRR